ncbi:hypothetical protein V5799_020776 [Amblyomma americanum]|uniref:Uncharacterized protein n=1 Tax=Amblyomma americanum TaxID=6943 RepID=A0AAQ4ET44_AMBAM
MLLPYIAFFAHAQDMSIKDPGATGQTLVVPRSCSQKLTGTAAGVLEKLEKFSRATSAMKAKLAGSGNLCPGLEVPAPLCCAG